LGDTLFVTTSPAGRQTPEKMAARFPNSVSERVIGIDFGTDSVRSVVADATTGRVLGTSVQHYPRWAKGLFCEPAANQFRQHPLDYLESMEASVLGALDEAGPDA